MRRSPLGGHGLFGSELDVVLLHLRRGKSDFDCAGSSSFNAGARQVFGGGKSPRAVGKHAHAHSLRLGVGRAANLAVLRSEGAAALADDARIGVGSRRASTRYSKPSLRFASCGNSNLPRRHGGTENSNTESTAWRALPPALSLPPAIPSTGREAWWTRAHSLRQISPP